MDPRGIKVIAQNISLWDAKATFVDINGTHAYLVYTTSDENAGDADPSRRW